MTVLDCEQGSREWVEARLGRPTASEFRRILTAKRLTLSAQRHDYLDRLLAEWVVGEPAEEFESEWTERGRMLEPQARDYYAFHRDAEVQTVGLCVRDEDDAACSPDGLVSGGGLELKCPMAHTHIGYLARGDLPAAYVPQVQGSLWVTGREWWDFMSYHPDLPPLLLRVEPDERWQAALDEAVPAFWGEVLAGRAALLAKGVRPWRDDA